MVDFKVQSQLLILITFWPLIAAGQVNVITFHNDNARTGQNRIETILTPQNVNASQFGKLQSVPVDGYVHAQPLVLTNVAIPGQGTHDVLYIATENDSVYALDAKGGAVLWRANFLNPSAGITTVPTADLPSCTDVGSQIGITSTPVIDPASRTIYVVATTKENGTYVQRLHALDVATHDEKFGGPIVIRGSVPGTGISSQNGFISFDPLRSAQRSALLLSNGRIIIAWGSHCDGSPYHGWLMAYNAATLAQEAVLATTPNGSKGGVWMGGGGVAADATGNLYLPVSDGDYDGVTNWSDTVLKLSASSLAVSDFFTPYNQAYMQVNNKDLGSSGLLLLPDLPSGKQLLVLASKLGTIYLLDRSNLGKYCSTCTSTDIQIEQEISTALAGVYNSPAYWKGNVYFAGRGDYLKQFLFDASGAGMLSTQPIAQSPAVIGYPGATPSVSANGDAAGIVWVLDNSTWLSACCQVLRAYSADNVGTELYNTGQAANNRDVPGAALKFNVATIANGRVYVGSQANISIYGLIAAPAAATPTFNPPAGTYSSAQSVTISVTSPGVTVYYTTDGSTPTTLSTTYTGPISVSLSMTIKAIAMGAGFSASSTATATYTIQTGQKAAATPTFNPPTGTYTSGQSVAISDTSPNVRIYYTTNGTTPTISSTVYTTQIKINKNMTIKAIAAGGDFVASAVGSATYKVKHGK